MKAKEIITDGLAAMADEQEFRRWIAEFDCVLTGDLLYSWSKGRKYFGHSLAELAFKLREEAQKDHTDQHDIAIKSMADSTTERYNSYVGSKVWLWLQNDPKLEIITAIEALEGVVE